MYDISIIIPCFNAEKWIEESLLSCLNQTLNKTSDKIEIIIINDGSTDRTHEIIQPLIANYPQTIKYFYQQNSGPAKARNHGMKVSSGKNILFLDADDVLCDPHVLEKLSSELDDDTDIVYGNVNLVDQNGKFLSQRDQAPIDTDPIIAMMLKAPLTSAVLLRREITNKMLMNEKLDCCEEFEFFLTCAVNGYKIKHANINVSNIRQHTSPTRMSVYTENLFLATIAKIFIDLKTTLVERGLYKGKVKYTLNRVFVDLSIKLYNDPLGKELFNNAEKKEILFKYPKHFNEIEIAALSNPRLGHYYRAITTKIRHYLSHEFV